MIQQIKIQKTHVENMKKTKIFEKKNSRQLRGRGFPKNKNKKQNSEDPSGSIRDITVHLNHDKNTSIAVPCTVFNVPSAGYNLRWIYWSYEFFFFDPGALGPEARHDRTRVAKTGRPKG